MVQSLTVLIRFTMVLHCAKVRLGFTWMLATELIIFIPPLIIVRFLVVKVQGSSEPWEVVLLQVL